MFKYSTAFYFPLSLVYILAFIVEEKIGDFEKAIKLKAD